MRILYLSVDVWKNIIAGIAVLVTLIGFIWSAFVHFDNKELESKNSTLKQSNDELNSKLKQASLEFQAKAPFFKKQLDLCIEAADQAATIASNKDLDRIAGARERFFTLFFGSLVVVEDGGVSTAMREYRRGLINFEAGKPNNLKSLALEIGKACRDLISKSWDLNLPEIRRTDE